MSYLLDKKIKRKKFFKIIFGVVFLIILFYFRFDIFDGLSSASQTLFRPVLVMGNNIGEKFKNVGSYFASKNSLYLQNQKLRAEAMENEARMLNYNSVLSENENLKMILGRPPASRLRGQEAGKGETRPNGLSGREASIVLAAILSKPNQSLYDTLVIDAGKKQGIKMGDAVFALGSIPIGRIDLVYENSAKIILFSSAGEKTQAIISGRDVFIELIGRGGGNFEIILPRDFILQKGDQVVMPGLNSYVLAIVQTIISDPRDYSNKVLLTSPINIQEIKFVEVEIG